MIDADLVPSDWPRRIGPVGLAMFGLDMCEQIRCRIRCRHMAISVRAFCGNADIRAFETVLLRMSPDVKTARSVTPPFRLRAIEMF